MVGLVWSDELILRGAFSFYFPKVADSFIVTGHFKTSQSGANQNRPLLGALFAAGFLKQARGFSFSSYLLLPFQAGSP